MVEGALPYDRVGIVLEEKLLGANGSRPGATIVAWERDRPLGLIAMAGRWVKLLVVDREHRGRGVAKKLLELARNWVHKRAGGGRLRFMDHPGNYLSPGIDERAEDARAWVERQGFHVRSTNLNLRVPIEGNPRVTLERAAELRELAQAKGYIVRRAIRRERAGLVKMVGEAFASAWAFEVGAAMDNNPPTAFVAWRASAPVAFAVHDGNNRGLGWFGPAGTLTAHRGKHLGESLLLECLLDARPHPEAGVIAWIGPREFYEKVAGAVDDRRFVVYEEEE